MTKHEIIVEREGAYDTRLEIVSAQYDPRQVFGSALRNVEKGAPCVVLGYSTGTERNRSGMVLPAMTPHDARSLAALLSLAADEAEL